jgi:LAO/AO transport system kinase
MNREINGLLEGMFKGEEASLGQLMTLVEADSSSIPEIMGRISSRLGNSYQLGITGSQGVGKSTLVDRLIPLARKDRLSVGVIAVDPSSAISGGALLGDRVRMQQHSLDNGVFIRSMATRGKSGGLSQAVSIGVKLLEAFGKDMIMVETTGVGQTEVDIKDVVDTVVAIFTPECGDSIQFMKAGLLEIADIIVVNKADRGAADLLASEIRDLLSIGRKSKQQVPVITAQANSSVGTNELYQEIKNLRLLKKRQD